MIEKSTCNKVFKYALEERESTVIVLIINFKNIGKGRMWEIVFK